MATLLSHQPNTRAAHNGMDVIRVLVEFADGYVLDITPILEAPRKFTAIALDEYDTLDVEIACRAVPTTSVPNTVSRLTVSRSEK